MTDLIMKKCVPCAGSEAPLTRAQAHGLLGQVAAWQLDEAGKVIYRDYTFKNFYHVMAFVNAIAWLSHQQNHHPDLEIGYQHCLVRYSTHALNGLSENDFICAAKVNALVEA